MTPEEKLFWENRPPTAMQALHDVMAERRRQMMVEGWTAKHDDEHGNGELAFAAACYAHQASARGWVLRDLPDGQERYASDDPPDAWPDSWDTSWWKPKDPRRDLVRAAALLLAEIERMDRAAGKAGVAPSAEAQAGQLSSRLHAAIVEALEHHHMRHTVEDEESALPLVDMLTPRGDTDIARGKEELELLADAIWNEVDGAALEWLRTRGVPRLDGKGVSPSDADGSAPMVSGDSEANKEKG